MVQKNMVHRIRRNDVARKRGDDLIHGLWCEQEPVSMKMHGWGEMSPETKRVKHQSLPLTCCDLGKVPQLL